MTYPTIASGPNFLRIAITEWSPGWPLHLCSTDAIPFEDASWVLARQRARALKENVSIAGVLVDWKLPDDEDDEDEGFEVSQHVNRYSSLILFFRYKAISSSSSAWLFSTHFWSEDLGGKIMLLKSTNFSTLFVVRLGTQNLHSTMWLKFYCQPIPSNCGRTRMV